MTSVKIACIISLCLTSALHLAKAQSVEEVNQMKLVFPVSSNAKEYHLTKNSSNEVQVVLSGMFLFYKKFISSQDGVSCGFTPSCSEYGLEAVQKQGVVIGVINTCDRLLRCNGLSPEKYSNHPITHLMYDPL